MHVIILFFFTLMIIPHNIYINIKYNVAISLYVMEII